MTHLIPGSGVHRCRLQSSRRAQPGQVAFTSQLETHLPHQVYTTMTYSLQSLDVLNVILGKFVKKDARITLSVFKSVFYMTDFEISHYSGVSPDMS